MDAGGAPVDVGASIGAGGADVGSPTPGSDAATSAANGPASSPGAMGPLAGADGPSSATSFSCSLVIGPKATAEWFNAGFEQLVPDGQWELLAVTAGWIEAWADPAYPAWTSMPSSPCATAPDRVIFVGVDRNHDSDQVAREEWIRLLKAVVGNLTAKFSTLRRIELATFVRAPGNIPCAASFPKKSWIDPVQDEANTIVSSMFPTMVTVAPKFEVQSCADFGGNPPHFSTVAAPAVAIAIASHYKTH